MADLNSVGFSTNDENEVDLEGLRTRFRKMQTTNCSAISRPENICASPHANFGKPPRQVFVVALQEARAELERRKPERSG